MNAQATLRRPHHRGLTRQGRRTIFVLSILIPFAIWMLIYMFAPLASVVMYSFTDAKMAYNDFSFKGFYQYTKMMSQKASVASIINSVKAAVIIIPIGLVLAMLTAVGLNALGDKLRGLYTFAFFLPNIMSLTAICLVFRWIYHKKYGILNLIIQAFGGNTVRFL